MSLDRTPAAGLRLDLSTVMSVEQRLRLQLMQTACDKISAAADELAEAAELARLADELDGDAARGIRLEADRAGQAALNAAALAGCDLPAGCE